MKNHNLNFLELVESSLKEVKECDIHQVKDLLEKDEDFFLIDVRRQRMDTGPYSRSPSSRKRNNRERYW